MGLDNMQPSLLEAARDRMATGVQMDATYKEMRGALINDKALGCPGAGLFLVPWKCDADNKGAVKEECKAVIRCYPLDVNDANMVGGVNSLET